MPRGSAESNPLRIDALGLFPPSKMSGPNGTFESVGTSLNTFDCEYASVLIYMYTILYNILQYCVQYCRDDQPMHWSRMVRSHLQPRISMPCKSKINTPRFLSHFSRRFKHFYFATFSSCSGSKPWSWLLTPHRKLQQATLDRKDNTNHSSRNARTEVPQTNDFTSVILGHATVRPLLQFLKSFQVETSFPTASPSAKRHKSSIRRLHWRANAPGRCIHISVSHNLHVSLWTVNHFGSLWISGLWCLWTSTRLISNHDLCDCVQFCLLNGNS